MNNKTKDLHWRKTITRFLTAQTISLLGSSLVQYAIVWYITLSTGSGKLLMISTVCGFLPQILISLFAGVWIDRYDRKKMIMLADAMIAFATLILALVFMSGNENIGLLFAVLMVRSAGTGIQTPAVYSVIPQIVPKEYLMKVSGIYSTISSLIMFMSPAISGALLSFTGIEVTFLVDVVTAMMGIGITLGVAIPSIERMKTATSDNIGELKQGFAYLKTNPFIKRLLIFQLVVLFLISPSAFLTPLMVSRTFGSEIWRLSASEMTYSVGAALGGLLIASWGGFKDHLKTTIIAGAVYGILMIGMGLSHIFILYLGLNTLIGITGPCYNSPITVSIQETVEPAMHGRVFSFMQIATSCALPMGMMLFGPLADIVPIQSLMIVDGLLVMMAAMIMWLAHYDRKDTRNNKLEDH